MIIILLVPVIILSSQLCGHLWVSLLVLVTCAVVIVRRDDGGLASCSVTTVSDRMVTVTLSAYLRLRKGWGELLQ